MSDSRFFHNLDLTQIKARPARNAESRFPCKLYRLLLDVEEKGLSHIISWHPSGVAFRVHDPEKFTRDIMPVYFKPGKFRSFQRQLNLYGFQRFTALKPFWESCYRHPAFSIQHRMGCTKIDRPKREQKKSSSDSQIPKEVGQAKQPAESLRTVAASATTVATNTQSTQSAPSLSTSSAVASPQLTILPTNTPSSSVLTSYNETNHGWDASYNNINNDGWLESKSTMISREQMMADAAAARWRRLGETLQEQIQSTASRTPTNSAARNDTLNIGWNASVPVPNKPSTNHQLIEPLVFSVDQQPELSSGPPDVSQSHDQHLLPAPPALQKQQNNDTVANTTIPQMWDENDVNLCHEIMGQDCELCMDGNKLVEDFFRQRSQNNL